MDPVYFGVDDYAIFGILLALSASIGIYFAFFAKQKQNSTVEYLLGGKTMGILPIASSMVASFLSGIALLGYATEMYTFGTQLSALLVAEFISSAVVAIVFIPVFFKLQVTSSYEYLEKRFGPSVRTLSSAIFICRMMLYIPIVIYIPALALSQVSGLTLQILIPVITIVCTFYTTLGGMKAVVWTDTLQMIVMLLGVFGVAVFGTIAAGGVGKVYEKNQSSGRLEMFNTALDPTIRHTFWNVLLGKFTYQVSKCVTDQSTVQRCLSLSSLKKAQMTMAIFALGFIVTVGTSFYIGVAAYAVLGECDPLSVGSIKKADQLLPFFVMNVLGHIPLLPGIFMSGLFSAALSTMSTGLNSMCGVILQDFIKPTLKGAVCDARALIYLKLITIVTGCLCLILAFMVDNLAGIVQASGSLSGITAGTLLGIFMLGMLFPSANSTGALIGGIISTILVGWMSIGSQLAIHNKTLVFPKKPVSIDGCDNITLSLYWEEASHKANSTDIIRELPNVMFRVSYVYYPVIGTLIVLLVGMIVSYLTGYNNNSVDMNPDLFSPVIHGFLNQRRQKKLAGRKASTSSLADPQETLLLQESIQ